MANEPENVLSNEELEAESAELLPERQAMSRISIGAEGVDNFATVINEATAMNVASDKEPDRNRGRRRGRPPGSGSGQHIAKQRRPDDVDQQGGPGERPDAYRHADAIPAQRADGTGQPDE